MQQSQLIHQWLGFIAKTYYKNITSVFHQVFFIYFTCWCSCQNTTPVKTADHERIKQKTEDPLSNLSPSPRICSTFRVAKDQRESLETRDSLGAKWVFPLSSPLPLFLPLPPSSPSLPPTLRFANRKLETIRRVRRCYWSRDSVGAARLKPHSGWEAFHAILRETHTLCLSRWVTSSGRPARQQNCYGAQTRVTDEGNREWNMFVPSLVIENDCNLGKCLIILQYSTVTYSTRHSVDIFFI